MLLRFGTKAKARWLKTTGALEQHYLHPPERRASVREEKNAKTKRKTRDFKRRTQSTGAYLLVRGELVANLRVPNPRHGLGESTLEGGGHYDQRLFPKKRERRKMQTKFHTTSSQRTKENTQGKAKKQQTRKEKTNAKAENAERKKAKRTQPLGALTGLAPARISLQPHLLKQHTTRTASAAMKCREQSTNTPESEYESRE